MVTLSTFSSWKGRSALLKGAGLIHNVWYFLFTIPSNLHYSNKNYAFLPHLWQKIIGNSKGEGSLKPVISNQLGSAWKTTFPKLMVPILCNFYYCFTWHPETSKLHYLSRNSCTCSCSHLFHLSSFSPSLQVAFVLLIESLLSQSRLYNWIIQSFSC